MRINKIQEIYPHFFLKKKFISKLENDLQLFEIGPSNSTRNLNENIYIVFFSFLFEASIIKLEASSIIYHYHLLEEGLIVFHALRSC